MASRDLKKRPADSPAPALWSEKPISLSPENIEEARRILKQISESKSFSLAKENPFRDLNSLKVLRKFGFVRPGESPAPARPNLPFKLDEIRKVLALISPSFEGEKVTMSDLRDKLPYINPKFPLSEAGYLLQKKEELSAQELLNLLEQCEDFGFDEALELFSILDTKREGKVSPDHLVGLMRALGFKNVAETDRNLVLECLDLDKDGVISLDDLRELLNIHGQGM